MPIEADKNIKKERNTVTDAANTKVKFKKKEIVATSLINLIKKTVLKKSSYF